MQATQTREQRGRLIFEKGTEIHRVDENRYEVNSQTRIGEYEVIATEIGWLCSCPDHTYRDVECKHIWAVKLSLNLRNEVEVEHLAPFSNTDSCLFCGSKHIVKDGIRHNKHGDIQKFNCLECKRYFTINVGFEKMKHNPKAITSAMQLYFSGESLRNVAESLRLMGAQVSHQTIYNWIQKYIGLMEKYLDRITPQVSETWRADELFLKVRGNMKYLYALMDDETRFWIAQEVADTKYTHDARRLFQMGKARTGKKPWTLITDGAPNYRDAFRKEFYAYVNHRAEHIREIRMDGSIHNNKMERLNGEIRDREKTMRGIKRDDSVVLKGYQIFHNYIRPHEGLDGATPAEKCGIKVEGENRWITIIQNASKKEQRRDTRIKMEPSQE